MTHWTNVSSRTLTALTAWLGTVSCVTPLFAQIDAGIAPKTDKQQRPGTVLLGNPAEPTKTAANTGSAVTPGGPTNQQLKGALPPNFKISPELETLLVAWEKQSQAIQRLNGAFRLYTYDEVFQTETRGTGKFWYAGPDKGRMDFDPADLSKCPTDKAGKPINPKMVGPNGAPYEVKKRTLEVWNCNGAEILQIFPESKSYSRVTIPLQFQGASIKESPLPFLFGLKKDEAKERYLMQLGSLNGKVPQGYKAPCVHVTAYPLREQDSREWSKAEVLLDAQTFLPLSIQTFDPAGTGRNVYAFSDVEVNARWLFKDPFSIPVTGLTLIHDESTKPSQGNSVPGGQAPKPPVKGAGALK